MVLYAPDSDVLALFQQLRMEECIIVGSRAPLVVTDVVWDELTGTRVPEHYAERTQKFLASLVTGPTEIMPASPEAISFSLLHPDLARADAGEDSIIAYALHHPEIVPVLRDKQALVRAVEELRGRAVLSVHGFLAVLFDAGCVSLPTLIEFGRSFRKRYMQPEPTWWAGLTHQA